MCFFVYGSVIFKSRLLKLLGQLFILEKKGKKETGENKRNKPKQKVNCAKKIGVRCFAYFVLAS